jgi:hypothetical protein
VTDRGDWRDADREVTRGTLWGTKWFVGVVIAFVVVMIAGLLMWTFGFGLFQRGTADFRGGTEARERIVADGDYRIQVYNRFFTRCAAVQAAEDRINALNLELATNPPPARVAIIQASLAGIRAQRASAIRTYNAEAESDFTAGQFRDLDLPHQLDVDQEATQCASSTP